EAIAFGHGSIFVVKSEDLVPAEYGLAQNYPNPFNPVTSIAYSLPQAAKVKVFVYNTLGQVVAELVDGDQEAGHHVVTWDAADMASGVYFYRIEANDFTATRRMVLMK
ncbi:MAG: T9SS type A sorting domain-containing protein, partial [Gemmatimonadota bacterium]